MEYFSEISSAAPNTPLLYYHFVAKSGINFDVIELLEKMKKRVPTFAGIKFTDNNLGQVAVAIDKFGDEMVVGNGHCSPFSIISWSDSDHLGQHFDQ